MKTLHSRRLLLLVCTFAFIARGLIAAAGEWITLQIPLSRSSHSFTLVEDTGSGPLIQTPTSVPFLYNGYYDVNDNWRPYATSYATVQVERQSAGTFWLKDTTAPQYGPPNQLGLVNAEWRESYVETGMRYFTLPDELKDYSLLVYYTDGRTVSLTQGLSQGFVNEANVFVPYGFFEAWAAVADPDTEWRLVNCTLGLQAPVNTKNLIGAEWATFTDNLPASEVDFAVGYTSDEYTLYVQGGAAYTGQTVSDGNDMCHFYGVIPHGYRYWLVRSSDQRRTPDYIMPTGPAFHYVEAIFGPEPEPTEMWFHFTGFVQGPSDFQVLHADGSTAEFITNGSYDYEVWDGNGNLWSWSATIATAFVKDWMPWSVARISGGNFGQTTSVYEENWSLPAIINGQPPEGFISLAFPAVRAQNMLELQDSNGSNWSFQVSNTLTVGGPNGPNGEWVEWAVDILDFPITGDMENFAILDQTRAESLAVTSPGQTENWFVPQALALKISTTRFGHQLKVRTENGQELPVQAHQVQGVWTPTPTGTSFGGYGYFDASATANVDLLWWVLDYSRLDATGKPEVLMANPSQPLDFSGDIDETDSDGDGWQDWYERFMGTDPNNPDTDGDGEIDSLDSNPRALPANIASSTLKVFTPLE